MKHLLTLADYSVPQILHLVQRASDFKQLLRLPQAPSSILPQSCAGRSLAVLFNKRSTRTRVAAESSFSQLGGHPLFLGKDDVQLGVNESLRDTARVLGSMCDMILLRCGSHFEAVEMAKYSNTPVVNALTDLHHPTQILADLQTMFESFAGGNTAQGSKGMDPGRRWSPNDLAGLTVAWVGDANNILNSMLVTLPRFGVRLRVATPRGYAVNPLVLNTMAQMEGLEAAKPVFTHVPEEAVRGADVIVTDTWISMGMEEEKQKRLKDFHGFQVTKKLCQSARPGWRFMHCLPRKQEEVSDEVFYDSERSLVFQEAENRKHTMMAVFDHLIGQPKDE